MELYDAEITFIAYGLTHTEKIKINPGWNITKAKRFVKTMFDDTGILISYTAKGETLYNEDYKPFEIVFKHKHLIKKQ